MFGWVRSIPTRVRPKGPGSPAEAEAKGPEAAPIDFVGADLSGKDFGGAILDDANLSRAKLDGAIFRNASLRRANLSDASGLRSDQFPGADLTGAKLPDTVAKFETLSVIKDASDQAKTLFIALMAACAFSWLTIGATRDASLLSNSSTTPLPIINVPLPIDDFYLVAPVLLLIAFLYFHLSLQRLWEQLADLPAFFPDGNAADKRVYPWLLSGLMRSKTDRLRRDPRAMGKLQTAVSVLLAYALAPLTLIGFWGRYLTAHDWIGTGFHAGLIVIAAGLAVAFWRQLGTTFAGRAYQPAIWPWSFPGALLALAPVLGNALKLALPSAAHIAVWVFAVVVLAVAGEVVIRRRGFRRALKHGTAAAALVAVLVLVSVGS
ncbi:MAG TPA: pentapeptide repeat-containing protein, partial [Bryobacteraceae bacterium]